MKYGYWARKPVFLVCFLPSWLELEDFAATSGRVVVAWNADFRGFVARPCALYSLFNNLLGAEMDLQLTTREIVGMYLFLKAREQELDPTLDRLTERIAHLLYDVLSIEQFEGLERLYRDNVDVPPEKE